MTDVPDRHARLVELWLDDQLVGLSPEDAEQRAALEHATGIEADPSLERAAAALHLAMLEPPPEVMPEALQEKIVAAFSEKAAEPDAAPVEPRSQAVVIPWMPAQAEPAEVPSGFAIGWGRWAATVLIAVLVGALGTRLFGVEPSQNTTIDLAPRAARQALLADAKDVIRLEWKTTDNAQAQAASGDLVWSPSKQRGFMRFRGLAKNVPEKSRYQLWIFDQKRDERYPVDGGVFDIAEPTNEIVVPIDAKLPVTTASLFAVTVEPPKGVVVSDREQIVLTAKVKN